MFIEARKIKNLTFKLNRGNPSERREGDSYSNLLQMRNLTVYPPLTEGVKVFPKNNRAYLLFSTGLFLIVEKNTTIFDVNKY